MAFTDTEKVDIRRFCGYPTISSFGVILVADYGLLETRISNMQPAEEGVVRQNLVTLSQLEQDITGTRENLDTAQAAVWTHNPREQADRENLFNGARRRLCSFIGIRPGPGLGSGCRVVRC